MDELVHVLRLPGALHVELARPAKRNALTAGMYELLAAALNDAETDSSIRSIVFSGKGEAFCAGNDLGDFVTHPPHEADAPVFRFLRGVAGATKVLIAAVQGRAVGIGTTLLLHCDFVVAEPGALFSTPFVDLALVPEAGSSLLLPALMGQRKAADLLLLGTTLDAADAQARGLVNRISAPGQALQDALEIAATLAMKPAEALRETKRLMKLPPEAVLARIEKEVRAFSERLQSAELRERVAAFFARKA